MSVTVKRIRALTQDPVVVNYMTIDPQNPMDVSNEDILSSEPVKALLAPRELKLLRWRSFVERAGVLVIMACTTQRPNPSDVSESPLWDVVNVRNGSKAVAQFSTNNVG